MLQRKVPLPEGKKVGLPPPSAPSGSTHGNRAVKDAPKAYPKGLSLTALWSVLLARSVWLIQSTYLLKTVSKNLGALQPPCHKNYGTTGGSILFAKGGSKLLTIYSATK